MTIGAKARFSLGKFLSLETENYNLQTFFDGVQSTGMTGSLLPQHSRLRTLREDVSGVIASVLTMDEFNSFFHNPSASITGAVVATFTGGCFFGAAMAGWWNDHFGRKRTIQVRFPARRSQFVLLSDTPS